MKRWLTGVLFVLGCATAAICGPLKQPASPLQITADGRSGEISYVVLKNVSQKAVVQYQLACFKESDGKSAVDSEFDIAKREIAAGKSIQFSVSNQSPLEKCIDRSGRLGVESVTFQDGTTWNSGK